MRKHKPVTISNRSFLFCRYGTAIIVWLAVALRNKELMFLSFLILFFSALLKIKRAPMIFIYTHTINKIFKSNNIMLDEHAMRFAHSVGATLFFIDVIILYFINEPIGWVFAFILALVKTVGALGFCTATKLYQCTGNDSCCKFLK